MKTAPTAITDLGVALEAARASGNLEPGTEVYVNFKLPPAEYEALPGTEHVEDDPPEHPIHFKTVYAAQGDGYDLRITAGPEDG